MTVVRQRAARDERAVSAYVERLGDTLTDAGMPRLASRVFAQLLADDDGRMERERGSRRDVYVVQADAWHGAMLSRDRMLSQIETSLRAGVPAVGGLDTEAGRRLQLSVAFLEFLGDRLGELEGEWAAHKAEITRSWPVDA